MNDGANDKLSSKAKKAVAVLAAGGRFTERLERNYLGRMKFTTRLYDASGAVDGRGWFVPLLRNTQRGFGLHVVARRCAPHARRDRSSV